jgi:hypothetical protein
MKKLPLLALCGFLALTTSCKKSHENVEQPVVESPEIDTTTLTQDIAIEDEALDNQEEVANSGSKDYDQMLDDYDEYVNEYAKFYKKAMKGDNSAMSEYPVIMEKANALQQSMEEAEGNGQLSVKQLARMAEIQAKMLKAMQ